MLFALQRAAGNQAVSELVRGWHSVQRHPDTLPEVAGPASQTTNADQLGLPTAADKKDMLTQRTEFEKELRKLMKVPRAKRSEADKARLTEVNEQLRLIKHRLKLRLQGDATKDEAKTLLINGITGGAADWFANVHTVKFLDEYATVHDSLASRLATAEAALRTLPRPAGGWVSEEHSSLRGAGAGLHAYGLAIDLNPSRNPWLIDPEVSAQQAPANRYENLEQSESIRDVIGRAVLLVLGKSPTEEAFFTRPTNPDKNARVEASYDKLADASQALARYMTLDAVDNRPELDGLVSALGKKDPKTRAAADWAVAIADDRQTLSDAGSGKSWDRPQTGFLHLDKRLVKAMTDTGGAGLTWLGDATIASGRDIMHFDTRGIGPIKKVWKGGQEVSLGGG